MKNSNRPPTVPYASPVVPYATPVQYEQNAAFVERDLLVTQTEISLPPFCVKCNAPVTDDWRWKKTLYWHTPWIFVLIAFPGILVYAIVALAIRKKVVVEASLCEEHRNKRTKLMIVATVLSLGSFVALIGGFAMSDSRSTEYMALIGVLAFFVMLIAAVIVGGRARLFSAKKIDGRFAWLKGAGHEFLAHFPRRS